MDPHQVRVMKVVLLVLSAAAYRKNFQGQWRTLQQEYRALAGEDGDGRGGPSSRTGDGQPPAALGTTGQQGTEA